MKNFQYVLELINLLEEELGTKSIINRVDILGHLFIKININDVISILDKYNLDYEFLHNVNSIKIIYNHTIVYCREYNDGVFVYIK